MRWLIAIVSFLIGITVGFIGREFSSVTFKSEFDIADILTILLTVIVAALIQYHSTVRHSDVRAEKELLMNEVREIIGIANEIRSKFLDCYHAGTVTQDEFRAIKGALKNLASSMSMLEEGLQGSKMTKELQFLLTAKRLYFEYKALLTGGPYLQPYSNYVYNSAEMKFKSFRRELQILIRRINRH